ncbi:hypothetical protein LCGC14_3039300 [marine sediment metagenome]|uniref:Uncharacterized protein n=1 Tax=marine sediment metagenome TaxID=412755 RepID=A0A0F8WQN9_9ZZZZ
MAKEPERTPSAHDKSKHAVAEVPLTAFIGCDYDEFNPYTYRGVTLSLQAGDGSEAEKHIICSHSPLGDKNDAISVAKIRGARILVMSSWDNFLSDALREIVKLSKVAGKQYSDDPWSVLKVTKPE